MGDTSNTLGTKVKHNDKSPLGITHRNNTYTHMYPLCGKGDG